MTGVAVLLADVAFDWMLTHDAAEVTQEEMDRIEEAIKIQLGMK